MPCKFSNPSSDAQLSPKPSIGKKKRRCQVVGCTADLEAEKSYCWKKRICSAHIAADAVLRRNKPAHQLWRYCFQCGKLEPISNFDGAHRSCRDSLLKRKQVQGGRSCTQRSAGPRQKQQKKLLLLQQQQQQQQSCSSATGATEPAADSLTAAIASSPRLSLHACEGESGSAQTWQQVESVPPAFTVPQMDSVAAAACASSGQLPSPGLQQQQLQQDGTCAAWNSSCTALQANPLPSTSGISGGGAAAVKAEAAAEGPAVSVAPTAAPADAAVKADDAFYAQLLDSLLSQMVADGIAFSEPPVAAASPILAGAGGGHTLIGSSSSSNTPQLAATGESEQVVSLEQLIEAELKAVPLQFGGNYMRNNRACMTACSTSPGGGSAPLAAPLFGADSPGTAFASPGAGLLYSMQSTASTCSQQTALLPEQQLRLQQQLALELTAAASERVIGASPQQLKQHCCGSGEAMLHQHIHHLQQQLLGLQQLYWSAVADAQHLR